MNIFVAVLLIDYQPFEYQEFTIYCASNCKKMIIQSINK